MSNETSTLSKLSPTFLKEFSQVAHKEYCDIICKFSSPKGHDSVCTALEHSG